MAKRKTDPRNQKHGTDTRLKPMRWKPDILAKVFEPRERPRPVPSTSILDETIFCLKFNEMWLPHILGALQLLLEDDSWSGGQSEVFRAQQSIYLMLENLTAPCGDGGELMRTPEFRSIVVDGSCDQLQWKYVDEPDTEWHNLGTPICDGDDGEDATDGADGREIEIQTITVDDCQQIQWRYSGDETWTNSGDLICCDCVEPVPPNPVVPEDENGLYCSIAINVTRELRRIWDYAYADTDGTITGILDGLIMLLGGLALIVATPLAAGVAVAFLGALKAITLGASEMVENTFDDPAEERFRCYLYCILVEHDSPEITQEVIDEWALAVRADPLMPSISANFVGDLIIHAPIENFQWFAWASSEVDPAACDCPDCVLECFDYTLDAPPPADNRTVETEWNSEIGKTYRITVSGILDLATASGDHKMDACYRVFLEGDPWTPTDANYFFAIDGVSTSAELAFEESHVYEFERAGTGDPFVFSVYDIGTAENNAGSLAIEVCEIA